MKSQKEAEELFKQAKNEAFEIRNELAFEGVWNYPKLTKEEKSKLEERLVNLERVIPGMAFILEKSY